MAAFGLHRGLFPAQQDDSPLGAAAQGCVGNRDDSEHRAEPVPTLGSARAQAATSRTVGFLDLDAAHEEIAAEVERGWNEILLSKDFAGGAAVTAFEHEFAAYCGVTGCVGVANGTDALELGLRALGIGAGDEVVVPANSFIASAEAVSRAGATPTFVDVDPDTLLIDPAALPGSITHRTAAVMPVHLYGAVAPMDAVTAAADVAGLAVIEDAAQAQGARLHGRTAGSFGDVAGTSFYPGKNLGAYGEAGAVLSDDPDVLERVRALRNHGGQQRYVHEVIGCNSRMDSLQAVVLSAKLRRLEAWNEARRAAAARYADLLGGIDDVRLPVSAVGSEPAWHLYVVRVPDRDGVRVALEAAGIGVGIHYPRPIHLQAAYLEQGPGPGSCPVAEEAAASLLSLPMHPHLSASNQERVADVLARALR